MTENSRIGAISRNCWIVCNGGGRGRRLPAGQGVRDGRKVVAAPRRVKRCPSLTSLVSAGRFGVRDDRESYRIFWRVFSCRISHPRRRTCGSRAPPPCATARSAPRCAPRSRRPRRRRPPPTSGPRRHAARPRGPQGAGAQEPRGASEEPSQQGRRHGLSSASRTMKAPVGIDADRRFVFPRDLRATRARAPQRSQYHSVG